MVSTRSKTSQTHLKDHTPKSTSPPPKNPKRSTENQPSSKKRKTPPSTTSKPSPKRTKPAQSNPRADSAQAENKNPSVILINRAPVLQLWSACVTHHLYPSLPWSTCLSAGAAISTICAVVKGRSIGTISKPSESNERNCKRKEAKEKQGDLEEIHVMQFDLKLKDGLAVVGSEGKGKPANEDGLKKKFGENYEWVKGCFEEVLGSWEKEEEEELNGQAFGFYEGFRPEVKSGQKGWGRKGELDLERVKSVVRR